MSAKYRIVSQSIPQTKPCVLKRHKPLPYWNDDIKTAIRNRNRARNKINRTKNINDIIEHKRLKAIAQRVIRQTARQHWQSFCDTLHSQTRLGTVWNMARKMNGTKSNPTSVPLIQDGNVVKLNKDKAEVFARSFASVSSTTNYSPDFQRHRTNIEQNHTYLFTNNSPDTEITNYLNKDFTNQELSLAINQFKKNSSPGADRIMYAFFHHLPPAGLHLILLLFNLIWYKGQLPKAWKHAIVLPILKAGKQPNSPSSYRPISLTSALGKLHGT